MLARRADEVPWTTVAADGAVGCRMRKLVTATDGAPTFAMRQFEVDPGGCTPHHSHPWEHEVYILGGCGVVRRQVGETPIQAGMAVFVQPDETHSFHNTADEPLTFLCLIPVERA